MSVCDHTVMKAGNYPAAGFFKHEGEKSMDKTAKGSPEHFYPEG